MVGSGQRRPAALQQQCRAHHHAPLRSGLPVRAAWLWPLARPDSYAVFPGPPLRPAIRPCRRARPWGKPELRLTTSRLSTARNFPSSPVPDLEFSVSRTAIFAGAGVGFTTNSFLRSLFSTGNSAPGPTDPGDRRVDVDVQYTIPKLHNLLKIYVDTFTDDELFPLAYPTHSAWSPGFYLARLPHLPHVDFRGGRVSDAPSN